MPPTLIKDRDKEDALRKLAKHEFDQIYTLSCDKDGKKICKLDGKDTIKFDVGEKVRLLDEGTVVSKHGYPMFVIKKGAIKEWYDNLSDDFVGLINKAHVEFSADPLILGEWTKKDLTLVELEDGKTGVDVKPRFYSGLSVIEDLKKMPFKLGISSEFTYDYDYEASKKFDIDYFSSINIFAFAIVGQAGNVNSSGFNLNTKTTGGKEMALEIALNAREAFSKLKASLKCLETEAETEAEVEAETEAETEVEELKDDETTELLEKALSALEDLKKENDKLNEELSELSKEFEEMNLSIEERKKNNKDTAKKLKEELEKMKKEKDENKKKTEDLKSLSANDIFYRSYGRI